MRPGLAIVIGCWGRERLQFKRERAGLLSSLLILVTIALLVPALFDYTERGILPAPKAWTLDEHLSLGVAVVLLLVYFANLAYTTKLGTLTGFYYRVDEDEPVAALLRNSSQTFGGRFMGAYPFSKTVKLTYSASYANQSDIGTSPIDYSADYYLAEAGLEVKALKLGVGYEVLGADGSVTTKATGLPFAGGFAFQTPFATLHKFQGWADKFLVTPATGIKDLYGSAGYGWKKVGPFDTIGITAVYHDYKADRLGAHYGDEINLQLLAKVKKYTFTLKYADYNAKALFTDTRKVWASVEWAF